MLIEAQLELLDDEDWDSLTNGVEDEEEEHTSHTYEDQKKSLT